MSKIEVVEPEHRGEIWEYIYANDERLANLIPENKTNGFILCQCDSFGGKCPNNPSKNLVGSFQLCFIPVKK